MSKSLRKTKVPFQNKENMRPTSKEGKTQKQNRFFDLCEVDMDVLQTVIEPTPMEIQITKEQETFFSQYFHEFDDYSMGPFLLDHGITESKRHQLMSWMGQILGCYNKTTSFQTYYQAMSIFDHFLLFSKCKLSCAAGLPICIASILLSSKLVDIQVLDQNAIETITNDQISDEIIQKCELRIFETLDHDLYRPTYLYYLDIIWRYLESKQTSNVPKPQLNIFYLKSLYLMTFITQSYISASTTMFSVAYTCIDYVLNKYHQILTQVASPLKKDLDQIGKELEINLVDIQQLCDKGFSTHQQKFMKLTKFTY